MACRAKLLEMQCDFGQGWYFGRPATLQELAIRYAKPVTGPG